MKPLNEVDKALIEVIHNEQNHFDMDLYHTGNDDHLPATCETASCMAGWIVALYPEVAENFKQHCSYPGGVYHDELARCVYQHVSGELCTLDFYGHRSGKLRHELTRDDAILHIGRVHGKWARNEL